MKCDSEPDRLAAGLTFTLVIDRDEITRRFDQIFPINKLTVFSGSDKLVKLSLILSVLCTAGSLIVAYFVGLLSIECRNALTDSTGADGDVHCEELRAMSVVMVAME